MLNGPHSKKFLSTLSLRRATLDGTPPLTSRADFYPRSPCGERRHQNSLNRSHRTISIHALLAESDSCCSSRIIFSSYIISIHALLAESDVVHIAEHASPGGISIHALLAESDHRPAKSGRGRPIFLSTLSLRRATRKSQLWQADFYYFYPRSPCGERLAKSLAQGRDILFLSTLSLRRATWFGLACTSNPLFLSTLSLRRATGQCFAHYITNNISIHALLAESDLGRGEVV